MGNEADESFEAIFCGYIERINRGEEVSDDEVRRDHPEIASEILVELSVFREFDLEAKVSRPLRTLGDFELLGEIGRGGMGVVYEAWQNSMDRRVALKVLPAAVAADRRAFARFVREAQVSGQLRHPNVVPVYGLGLEAESPYYAMELVEGETLAQALARLQGAGAGAFTPFGACRGELDFHPNLAGAFADVADALQHAHAQGVVHRDIKPSNLIFDSAVDRAGSCRVCLRILDFGLARLEGHETLTLSSDLLGTPQYMSPEQARARKHPVDHRTDVYSLGATMYETLGGRPPFQGKDHQDTLSQILSRDPSSLRSIDPRIPRDLETIVLKCLRKEPGERFGTAEALAQDLRRFARGDEIEARPMSRWEQGLRRAWRQRVRVAAVASLALVAILAAALCGVLWKNRREWDAARYEDLVNAGIDALEIGLLTAPGELGEGETVSLGALDAVDFLYLRGAEGRGLDSESLLREAVSLLPERPEAYVHLSRALRAAGSRGPSREALRHALACDREFLPAVLHESHALREEGREPEADVLLRALDAGVSHSRERRWQRDWLDAHLAAIDGDWDRVESLYTELLKDRARPFAGFEKEVRLKRGRVRLRRGLGLAALQDFHYVREASGGAIGPTLLLASAYFAIDHRAEAVTLLDEAVGRVTRDADLRMMISLYLRFADRERAKRAVERLRDPCERYEALLQVTNDSARDVEIAERALADGCDAAFVHAQLAEGLLWTGRQFEAKERLLVALRIHPGEVDVMDQLQRVQFAIGEFDELLADSKNYEDPRWAACTVGWTYYRKGELETARAKLTEAIDFWPQDYVSYFGRSEVHYALGDFERALDDTLKYIRLGPHWDDHTLLRRLYNEPEGRSLYAGRWDDIDAACAAAARRPDRSQPRFLGFRTLAAIHGSRPDLDIALKLARDSISAGEARGPQWLPETLGYLAEVCFARSEHLEAIRTLERAVVLPSCWRSSADDLARYRRRAFPRLLTSSSVDAWLAGDFHGGRDPRLDVDVVQAHAEADSTVSRYLEALLLEREGRIVDAARILETIAARGDVEAAALLRLAELLARLGRRDAALGLIQERFAKATDRWSGPWLRWMRIASSEPALSALEMLERFQPQLEPAGAEERGSPLEDLVWALRACRDEGVLRIDCGSRRDYSDTQGRRWGRDRFFTGGRTFGFYRPRLSGTKDPELFYEYRSFGERASVRSGYDIPVPSGRHELILHFCQTVPCPKGSRFDLRVEGRLVREGIEASRTPGVGVAFEERFEVEISDGSVEIDLVSIEGEGFINAIELRALDPADKSNAGE